MKGREEESHMAFEECQEARKHWHPTEDSISNPQLCYKETLPKFYFI